jgi:hypothetical protein
MSHDPGPAASQAFTYGIRVAVAVALGGVGLLYLTDRVSLAFAGFLLVVIFPVYLLVVASALSRWLGLGKDVRDLRPVRRDESEQSLFGNGRQ